MSVAVTQLRPLPATLLASSFTDREDVKQALLATSCIPFYFKGARPFVTFRGAPAVDGFSRWSGNSGHQKQDALADDPGLPFPQRRWGSRRTTSSRRRRRRWGSLLQCALGAPPVDDSCWRALAAGAADAGKFIDAEVVGCCYNGERKRNKNGRETTIRRSLWCSPALGWSCRPRGRRARRTGRIARPPRP